MQYRRIRLGWSILFAVLALGFLSSCDGPIGPGAAPLLVIPAGPLDLMVGDTVTLRSSGGTGVMDIVFASSEPAVVAVTQQGLVTALSPGEARITVASQGVVQSAAVVVARVGSRGPASVVVESLLNDQYLPVTPSRIAGTVFTRVHIQRGDAARLEVLLGGVVACVQNFQAVTGGAQTVPSLQTVPSATLDCPIDTADFNSTTGVPRFLNGPTTVTARLVRIDGRVLDSATFPSIVLSNPNRIVATVSASREATDSQGRIWRGGDLDVAALPVLYDEGAELSRVQFLYIAPGPAPYLAVDSVAPFEIRLPADVLNTVMDENLRFTLTSVTTRLTLGPEGVTQSIRYDGSPPTPGTFIEREWIGADLQFRSLYVPPPVEDLGVGSVTVRFFGGDPSLTARQVVQTSPPVVRGSDLPQASVGAYRMIYEVCDALQNCRTGGDFLFGVDVTPPTIEDVGIPDRAVNPGADLNVRVQDDLSGFPQRPLEVMVTALLPDVVNLACGPTVEGISLPGRLVGGTCVPDSTGLVVPVPRTGAGYYTYRFRALDRAGNASPPRERTYLVDPIPPVLNSFVIPNQVVPGEEAVFSAEAVDNLDLAEVTFRLGFPGSTPGAPRYALPFAPTLQAGTPYSGTLTRTFAATARFPFVRTLTSVGVSAPRSTVLVDSAYVQATDAAGLSTRGSRALPASVFGGNVSVADPFSGVSGVVPLLNTQRVCTAGCTSTDPGSVTVTIRIAGEPGLSALSRMYLFMRREGGEITQVASTPTFSVTETGTQRTYTYTVAYTPRPGSTGRVSLFGVGLGQAGNALRTDDLPIEFFTR